MGIRSFLCGTAIPGNRTLASSPDARESRSRFVCLPRPGLSCALQTPRISETKIKRLVYLAYNEHLHTTSSVTTNTHLQAVSSLALLPPAMKLGQGYIFTGVCHSVNRGGVVPAPGGGLVPGGLLPGGAWWRPPPNSHYCGRYASYWNAFLLNNCTFVVHFNTALGCARVQVFLHFSDQIVPSIYVYRLQTKLWEGYVFTGVCLSVCPLDGG